LPYYQDSSFPKKHSLVIFWHLILMSSRNTVVHQWLRWNRQRHWPLTWTTMKRRVACWCPSTHRTPRKSPVVARLDLVVKPQGRWNRGTSCFHGRRWLSRQRIGPQGFLDWTIQPTHFSFDRESDLGISGLDCPPHCISASPTGSASLLVSAVTRFLLAHQLILVQIKFHFFEVKLKLKILIFHLFPWSISDYHEFRAQRRITFLISIQNRSPCSSLFSPEYLTFDT